MSRENLSVPSVGVAAAGFSVAASSFGSGRLTRAFFDLDFCETRTTGPGGAPPARAGPSADPIATDTTNRPTTAGLSHRTTRVMTTPPRPRRCTFAWLDCHANARRTQG